jgi:hypothetical protein
LRLVVCLMIPILTKRIIIYRKRVLLCTCTALGSLDILPAARVGRRQWRIMILTLDQLFTVFGDIRRQY